MKTNVIISISTFIFLVSACAEPVTSEHECSETRYSNYKEACNCSDSAKIPLLIYFDREPFSHSDRTDEPEIKEFIGSKYIFVELNIEDAHSQELLSQTGNLEPKFAIDNGAGYLAQWWDCQAEVVKFIENLRVGTGP